MVDVNIVPEYNSDSTPYFVLHNTGSLDNIIGDLNEVSNGKELYMPNNVKIQIQRRISMRLPNHIWFLCSPKYVKDFQNSAIAAGLEAKPIPDEGLWVLSHADSIYVETGTLLTDRLDLIEEVAKLGYSGEITLILELFSVPDDPQTPDIKFSNKSYLTEYQYSVWERISKECFDDRLHRINQLNFTSIRRGLLGLLSVSYGIGSFFFSPIGWLFHLLALLFLWKSPDSSATVTFVYLSHFSAGIAIHCSLTGRSYIHLRLILSAIVLAFAVHAEFHIGWQFLTLATGLASFHYWERSRDWCDQCDLMKAAFDREIERANPELRVPKQAPEIGSPEFILWRLEHLPVRSSFRPSRLQTVFISHRNSLEGISFAHQIEEILKIDFDVFLDRSCLRGGLIWRDQLLDGLRRSGFIVCVFTKEVSDAHYKWIRRELFAGCLSYRRYGTPIPIIIEAGFTLEEFLAREEQKGFNETPVHQTRDFISTLSISEFDLNGDSFGQQLLQLLRQRAEVEVKDRKSDLFAKRTHTNRENPA